MLSRLFLNLKIVSHSSFFAYSSQASLNRRLPHGYNPPSSYALYVKDNIKNGALLKELSKDIAKSWKNLNQITKDQYRRKAIEIGIERKIAFEKLSENEQQNLCKSDKYIKKKRIMRARRKIFHEHNEQTNRPQQPPSSFALFISQRMKNYSYNSLAERRDAFSKAAIDWKSIAKIDKEKLETIAEEKRKIYFNSLNEWKKEVPFIHNKKTKLLLKKYKNLHH